MTTKERIKGSYFGKTLDDGRNHLNKIRNLQLPIEEWAAFNHLAVFLRWMGEHNMLSERLLDDVSNNNYLLEEDEVGQYTILYDKKKIGRGFEI